MDEELKKLVNQNFAGVTSDNSYGTGVITPESFNATTPYQIPTATSASTNGIVSVPSLEQTLSAPTPAPVAATPAEVNQTGILGQLAQQYQKYFGKQQAQTDLETQVNLPQQQKDLAELNDQLALAKADYENLTKQGQLIPTEVDASYAGQGATRSGIAPLIGAKLKENTLQRIAAESKFNVTAALVQAKQGNISAAETYVDRAIKAQFEPIEKSIGFLTQFYQLNQSQLEREDRKAADALKIRIDERNRLLDQAKDDRKIILGYATEASKNNAPTAIVNRATQASSPQEALSILAPYMSDPLVQQQKLAELEQTRAQTAKIYADMALSKEAKAAALAAASINPNAKKELQNNEALALAKELKLDSAVGKSGAVGFGFQKLIPFGVSLGLQPQRAAFEAKVNTLKSNLTLDNLQLLKGAMSDKDLLFLNSIGSSLDVNMSESQFNTELDRIITKLESAGASVSNPTSGQTQVINGYTYVSDGTQWVLQE